MYILRIQVFEHRSFMINIIFFLFKSFVGFDDLLNIIQIFHLHLYKLSSLLPLNSLRDLLLTIFNNTIIKNYLIIILKYLI